MVDIPVEAEEEVPPEEGSADGEQPAQFLDHASFTDPGRLEDWPYRVGPAMPDLRVLGKLICRPLGP